MTKTKQYSQIVEKLKTHASMKQFIHRNTLFHMTEIKKNLIDLSLNLTREVTSVDHNVEIVYTDRGDFEAQLKFSGDVLIFSMHTNVFTFDEDHPIHKLDYVKENPKRAYCGLIQIYNFLSDTVKYNRVHDLGYLVGRIFINCENQFFIEGKNRIGFDYTEYGQQPFDEKAIQTIISNAILYCIDFELLTPPYEQSSILSFEEKQMNYTNSGMNTGKRLGFQFTAANTASEGE